MGRFSMFPVLPLARFGYTLHIVTITRCGLLPPTHIARLMCPNGRADREWTTRCYRWQLPIKVATLRCSLDGLIDPDDVLLVYYAEIPPPDRGLRQRVVFA